VGVAGIIIGVIGIIFAILPYPPFSQIAGVLFGIGGLLLCVVARKQARRHSQPTGMLNAGFIIGLGAVLLSGVVYGSCLCSYERVLGTEFERQLGTPEFQRAMKRAREAHQKLHGGGGKAPARSAQPAKKPSAPPVKKPPAKPAQPAK